MGSSAMRILWLACHGQSDYDPLALPAAQAVRVLEHPCSRVGDTYRGKQFDRTSTALVLVEPEVERQDLLEVVLDGQHGVERCQRVLRDHADLMASDPAHTSGATGRPTLGRRR